MLASQRNGPLYVGVTSDLVRRAYQRGIGEMEGFTSMSGVSRLVYPEFHATMPDAILREKQIKKWRRARKIALIQKANPLWRDLHNAFV